MSRKEKLRRQRDRHVTTAISCPHPSKTRFRDVSDAIAALVFHGLSVKDGWTTYECRCGFWHLSSKGTGRLISETVNPYRQEARS